MEAFDVDRDRVHFTGFSQGGFMTWKFICDHADIVLEHLRHTNGHVYPDNPDSLILTEDPSVGFSVGEAIPKFFIQNRRK